MNQGGGERWQLWCHVWRPSATCSSLITDLVTAILRTKLGIHCFHRRGTCTLQHIGPTLVWRSWWTRPRRNIDDEKKRKKENHLRCWRISIFWSPLISPCDGSLYWDMTFVLFQLVKTGEGDALYCVLSSQSKSYHKPILSKVSGSTDFEKKYERLLWKLICGSIECCG